MSLHGVVAAGPVELTYQLEAPEGVLGWCCSDPGYLRFRTSLGRDCGMGGMLVNGLRLDTTEGGDCLWVVFINGPDVTCHTPTFLQEVGRLCFMQSVPLSDPMCWGSSVAPPRQSGVVLNFC